MASIPTENGFAIAGAGSLSRVIGMLAFGLSVLSLVKGERVSLRAPSMTLLALSAYAWWSLATYFWSPAPMVTVSRFVTIAQLVVLFWLIVELGAVRSGRIALMQSFVVGCTILIGIASYHVLSGASTSFRDVGAFNPNGLAIVSALAVPIAWFLRSELTTVRRTTWTVLAAATNTFYPLLAFFGLVISGSRGGLLTFIVAVTIIPLTMARLNLRTRVAIMVVISATVIASTTLLPRLMPSVDANLTRLASTASELQGGTFTGRTEIWAAATTLFRDSPVVGIGVGAFPYVARPLLSQFKNPHNAFVSIAVGSGLIGLSLFASAFLFSVRSAFTSSSDARPYLVVLAFALFVGMLPTNSESDKFVWFILAIITAHGSIVISSAERMRRLATS